MNAHWFLRLLVLPKALAGGRQLSAPAALSALVVLGALLAFSGGSPSIGAAQIGPAGDPLADIKVSSVAVSYVDTGQGPGTPGDPIQEISAGEEFRVKVDFTFHNNGPDEAEVVFRVELDDAPDGCAFVEPSNGVDEFDPADFLPPPDASIPVSVDFMANVELKVRCDTPGAKTFGASVAVDSGDHEDPDTSNDSDSGTSEEPIPVTGEVEFRGDANCDGNVDLTDGIWMINQLFLGSATDPIPCMNNLRSPQTGTTGEGTADVDFNCDDTADTADLLYLLKYVGDLDNEYPAGCDPIGTPIPVN